MRQRKTLYSMTIITLCLFIVGSLTLDYSFAYSSHPLNQFMVLPMKNEIAYNTIKNNSPLASKESQEKVSNQTMPNNTTSKYDAIKVYIDNTLLEFPVDPILLDNEILVPMKTLFEALGSQVLWIDDNQEIIGYKNNMFIKLKINSPTAYINGNPVSLSTPPIIHNSRTMMPANFIANAFDMSASQEVVNNELILKYNTIDRNYIYKQIDNEYYKYVTNPNTGFSLYIPLSWKSLNNNNEIYGIDNEFQSINMSIVQLPLTKDFSIDELTQIYTNSLKMRNPEYKINGRTNITINEMPASVIFYSDEHNDNIPLDEPLPDNAFLRRGFNEENILAPLNDYYISYLFINGSTAYLLKGSYQAVQSEEYAIDTFNKIVNTFQINNLTVDEGIEHYIEYTPFFKYHINYTSPIYSNIQVYNNLPFSGTIDEDERLKGFEILVSKDDKSYYYYVPILEGTFDAKIPLPFGLGQHNIDISLDIDDTHSDNQEIVTPVIERIILDPSSQIQSFTTDSANKVVLSENDTIDQYVNEALLNSKKLESDEHITQFSVINLSNHKTQYVLSTKYVNSNNVTIRQLATSETYNLVNDYSKAKALYLWMEENIDLANDMASEKLQTSTAVLKSKSGNPIEQNFLYASLLRSINVEARIVEGQKDNQKYYWTEVYLNGKWYVADICEQMLKNDNSHTVNQTKHFMVPLEEVEDDYTDIIILLF